MKWGRDGALGIVQYYYYFEAPLVDVWRVSGCLLVGTRAYSQCERDLAYGNYILLHGHQWQSPGCYCSVFTPL